MSINTQNRRQFLKTGATTSAFLMAPALLHSQNINDKIRVGFIGVGNRGTGLMHRFMQNNDVEVAALCDVYKPYTTRDRSQVDERILDSVGGKVPKMGETFPSTVKQYSDFRNLLEDKSIDAVCIATPDHWHAVQTILACDAGKDVYVEKPLTMTIHEGRRMVEVAKKTNRVVTVGLNRRGSSVYQKMVNEVKAGKIGEVSVALAGRVSNMYPDGIGRFQHADPPADLDWDMWLGPRPARPFQYNITPYKFRWWKNYSSQMGNWGVHYMDAIRWMIGERAPKFITAHGSSALVNDDRTIPVTMEVLFEFQSGTMIKFSINEACSGGVVKWGEIELRASEGNLFVHQGGYRIEPAHPGQFQTWDAPVPEEEKTIGDLLGDPEAREDSTGNLIRNFLDCVKSRKQPMCTLEDGHRSTTFAHLANIALETGERIEWDANKERITNIPKANDLLHYEYRKPWTL